MADSDDGHSGSNSATAAQNKDAFASFMSRLPGHGPNDKHPFPSDENLFDNDEQHDDEDQHENGPPNLGAPGNVHDPSMVDLQVTLAEDVRKIKKKTQFLPESEAQLDLFPVSLFRIKSYI